MRKFSKRIQQQLTSNDATSFQETIRSCSGWTRKFFQLSMAHTNLESYYKINFSLMQHHKYSLTEIENMMPWERDVYVGLLQQYIEEENLKAQQSRGL